MIAAPAIVLAVSGTSVPCLNAILREFDLTVALLLNHFEQIGKEHLTEKNGGH